jgi:acyl-CoA thioester hydrolase
MSTTAPVLAACRVDFGYFLSIPLRWNDMDPYRHLNNARYYAFFDSVIMHYLTVSGRFDLLDGPVVPFTVENACRFHRGFAFPDVIDAGLRVARLGNSSVRYEMGLFRAGDEELYATGHFVDVFVDRETQQPQTIPDAIRAHLTLLLSGATDG